MSCPRTLQRKPQRMQCDSNTGPLDYVSNTLPLSHVGPYTSYWLFYNYVLLQWNFITLGCDHIELYYSGIRCTFIQGTRMVWIDQGYLIIPGHIRLRSHRTILFAYTVHVYAWHANSLNRPRLSHNTGSHEMALLKTAVHLRILYTTQNLLRITFF